VDSGTLIKQAQQTYERITRRLEAAIENQNKFPPRGRRTTAYMALLGHIERLRGLQAKAHKRHLRRQHID
jgi:DNA-binding phage protein